MERKRKEKEKKRRRRREEEEKEEEKEKEKEKEFQKKHSRTEELKNWENKPPQGKRVVDGGNPKTSEVRI